MYGRQKRQEIWQSIRVFPNNDQRDFGKYDRSQQGIQRRLYLLFVVVGTKQECISWVNDEVMWTVSLICWWHQYCSKLTYDMLRSSSPKWLIHRTSNHLVKVSVIHLGETQKKVGKRSWDYSSKGIVNRTFHPSHQQAFILNLPFELDVEWNWIGNLPSCMSQRSFQPLQLRMIHPRILLPKKNLPKSTWNDGVLLWRGIGTLDWTTWSGTGE